MKSLILIGCALVFFTSSAFATRADHRQNRQKSRIVHGVKKGELTKGEARNLAKGQRRVQRAEAKALANDGEISPREKVVLEKMQDRQSRKIYRMKHNENKPKSKE